MTFTLLLNSIQFTSTCFISVFSFANYTVADPGFSKWGGAVLSQMGGRTSCFQVKSAWKLKEIGLKWGGARLLAPCYSKITIFL